VKPSRCGIVVAIKNDACGEPATHDVVWRDGDRTPACASCAMNLTLLAERARVPLQTEARERRKG